MNRAIIITLTLIIGIMAITAYTGVNSQIPKAPCGTNSDGSYTLCTPIPGINPVQNNFTDFLNQIYRLAIMLAGTIVFIRIVYGGLLYSFSTVVDKKREAKAIFIGVAQGLALLMGAYLILNIINPALTRFDLPHAEYYIDNRNQTLNKNYNDIINRENTENQRAERDAQENLFFVQDYIQSLEDQSDRTPQQEEMLTQLKNERLPEARREAATATNNRISLNRNDINSQITDLENKRIQGFSGTSYQFQRWFGRGGNTAFSYNDEIRLQNLYEQRDSLLKQKQQR